ncbi:MAG: hypothetical protein ACRC14_01925, partial [Paracoccaceae bacterium]
YANSAAGIRVLVPASPPDTACIFEATSGCDRRLRKACDPAQRRLVRLNPLHAWRFAQSLNLPQTARPIAP